ncbi:MAG: SBBP repeat-containing protein [Candidatus Thorarchaeota archaeon]
MKTIKKSLIITFLILIFFVNLFSFNQLIITKNLSNKQVIEQKNNSIANINDNFVKTFFIENNGQLNSSENIKFYTMFQEEFIGFSDNKIFLWKNGWDSKIELSFNNSKNSSPIGIDKVSTEFNFVISNFQPITKVHSFKQISYYNLWDGIDLHYMITSEGVKYEFHVSSGSDPNNIVMFYKGQEEIIVNKQSLEISLNEITFIDNDLKVYQDDEIIKSNFIYKSTNSVGFQIESYNKSKLLIIDPLIYSTYIGGSSDAATNNDDFEWVEEIFLDEEGYVYLVGQSTSTDFPCTDSAFNSTYSGGISDGFVMKLDPNCSSIIFCTFIGGSGRDYCWDIKVDSEGFIYIGGSTTSRDFPVTPGANDTTHLNYYWDGYVAKLSPNGSSLVYSTYIGGGDSDYIHSIDIDDEGCVYIIGETYSYDFIRTEDAFDKYRSGEADGFIVKLSNDGSKILYSTYMGGSGNYDSLEKIVVDSEKNIYCIGYTPSGDFPITSNAYDKENEYVDIVIFKFSYNFSVLEFSTFFGGSGYDLASDFVIDNNGDIIITGRTNGEGFPLTENAFDGTYNGGREDCFIAKLTANGSKLLYSTFFGGSDYDVGSSIAVDSNNNVYITGLTYSIDLPITANAFQKTFGGSTDIFILKLALDGSNSFYSSYLGGSSYEHSNKIILENENNFYIVGRTTSDNFPITEDALDKTYNNGNDGFLCKFSNENYTYKIGISSSMTIIFFILSNQLIIILVTIRKRNKNKFQ